MRTFGQNLRQIREALGLSQDECAARIKIPASHLSHFETGRREPSLSNLRKIKAALGASWEALLRDQ